MTENQPRSVLAARAERAPVSLILLLLAGIVAVFGIGLTLDPREVPSPLVGCAACRDEHSVLLQLKQDGFVPIHGLNYKDRAADAARWLDEHGDPYTRTGADLDGRVAIDWGVYGVPETFVVDREGRIAYKHIGPVTPEVLQKKLRPLILRLRAGSGL